MIHLIGLSRFFSVLEIAVDNPADVQSVIAINWLLCLFVICSPAFLRQPITVGMVEMYGNEVKVTNNRFDGNSGNAYFPCPFSIWIPLKTTVKKVCVF